MFIVIEGDNGTGKTTIGNMLKEKGYTVISEEPEIIELSKKNKQYPPGSMERFNAFMKYNEYCLNKCLTIDNPVIIRSWISTVSAAYADGLMSLSEAKVTAEKFSTKYPIPDIIIRLQCDFSIRIKRIQHRAILENDKSDDLTKTRNLKYQEILVILKNFFPRWIDVDTTIKPPKVILNEILSVIEKIG